MTVTWQQSAQNFSLRGAENTSGGSGGEGGVLENPQPGSFQSGLGVLSGWVCDAQRVDLEIDGTAFQAAYGTSRGDTLGVCGDADNGFGLLFNWNLLADGTHTVRALADGMEFARATFSVTTLGVEFLTGARGSFPLGNFPQPGTTIVIRWQESLQNFFIEGVEGGDPPPFSSGIASGDITSSRDGTHTVRALADGMEFARATFSVTTLGVEFLTGARGSFPLGNFPQPGTTIVIRWQESLQNFFIEGVEGGDPPPFSSGIASGDITSSSAVLWTRADQEADLTVEVSTDISFEPLVFTQTVLAAADNDLTVHVTASPLEPAQTYFYRWRRGSAM